MKIEEILSKKHLMQIDSEIYLMKQKEPPAPLVKTLASYGLEPSKTAWGCIQVLVKFFRENPEAMPIKIPPKQPKLL